MSEVQQDGWIQTAPDTGITGDQDGDPLVDGDWDIVLKSGQVDADNNFGNRRIGECGWTPGKWAGGSLNDSVGRTGQWISVWDGISNDPRQLPQLSQRAQLAGDVLLVDSVRARQIVEKRTQGYAGATSGTSMPDLAIGVEGSLADWNADGKYDQLWYSGEDARTIINVGGLSGDKYGDLSRKTVAYLLNVLGQPNYVAAPEMQGAIYNWLFYYGYNTANNFKTNGATAGQGRGILSSLGNPDNSAGDLAGNQDSDFVINYKTTGGINAFGIGKAGGFGWDGKFSLKSSGAAWNGAAKSDTNGDRVIDYRDYFTEKTGVIKNGVSTVKETRIYSGKWIFEVLSAQFDDACNLALSLDGSTAYARKGMSGPALEMTPARNLMNWDPSMQLFAQ